MTLSTANQSLALRFDTVGAVIAGRSAITSWRRAAGTFILRPTWASARRAPPRRRPICSTFSRFHGTSHAARLAISCGTDSNSSHTIRSPWARIVEPVSVTSTMASTSPSATFASVAPHENSMWTSMPRSANQRRV